MIKVKCSHCSFVVTLSQDFLAAKAFDMFLISYGFNFIYRKIERFIVLGREGQSELLGHLIPCDMGGLMMGGAGAPGWCQHPALGGNQEKRGHGCGPAPHHGSSVSGESHLDTTQILACEA